MTDTAEEINSHFEEIGALTFDQEDGSSLGLTMFVCQSCGSLIAVREPHWNIHKNLGIAEE